MSDTFFLVRKSKRFGPYTFKKLQQLAAAGNIRPDDSVFEEGTRKTVVAGNIRGLLSATVRSHAVERTREAEVEKTKASSSTGVYLISAGVIAGVIALAVAVWLF